MNTEKLNLFIVDDNALLLKGLKNYLVTRFGSSLDITTFLTGKSAISMVNENTNIVILDYYLPNENGNDVLQSIKKINPKTEVIMLSSNEDIGVAIDSFRKGATDFVIKGDRSWQKISKLVYKIVTYPIEVLVREFGISKFVAIFLLVFVTMGIAVSITLKYIN